MAPNTIANATRFTIELTGNPATNAAKMKALAGIGTYILAKDHVLAMLMPEALNETQANKVTIRVVDVHKMLLPGITYSPDAAKGCLHFALNA